MQLFKSTNQECLLEGLKAIFEHIGGVPTAIWFDNMSTIVKKIKEYGERDLTKGFLRFMMHYDFRSNFCNPDSGHEKGSVEKTGAFIDGLENLILYGPVGTGKSHMATAIGVAACSRGKKVRFYHTAALVNLLSEAKAKGELQRFMKQLRNTDLLICDEWGYVPFEKDSSQLLFQVISECYEKRSVIITTKQFKDRRLGQFLTGDLSQK
jgi:hypothetical protein